MQLASYLEETGKTPEWLADQVGINPVSVRRYMRGERRPWPWVMSKIMAVTKGLVTPDDFFDPLPEPKKAARKKRPALEAAA